LNRVAVPFRLSWIQRITIVLFVIVAANWLMSRVTGYSLLGGDLLTIFLVVCLIFVAVTLIPLLVRKVL
jgi:hypothetical protein